MLLHDRCTCYLLAYVNHMANSSMQAEPCPSPKAVHEHKHNNKWTPSSTPFSNIAGKDFTHQPFQVERYCHIASGDRPCGRVGLRQAQRNFATRIPLDGNQSTDIQAKYPWPLLLTWFNPSMNNWLHPIYCVQWNYLTIPKLQRLQTKVILSHTLRDMWLLIHAGIKVKPC